jgi:hypothetical protein
VVGVKPSLLIVLHHRSNRAMIFPVGRGWQEGVPSLKFSLIVALGHSSLSFALGRWSPQHSILGTTVPSLASERLVPRPDPYVDTPCYLTASTHGLCRSGLQQWAQGARHGRPPNLSFWGYLTCALSDVCFSSQRYEILAIILRQELDTVVLSCHFNSPPCLDNDEHQATLRQKDKFDSVLSTP